MPLFEGFCAIVLEKLGRNFLHHVCNYVHTAARSDPGCTLHAGYMSVPSP